MNRRTTILTFLLISTVIAALLLVAIQRNSDTIYATAQQGYMLDQQTSTTEFATIYPITQTAISR